MRAKTGKGKTTAEVGQRSGKLLGYARVSTTDQDLTVQREPLRRAGADVIFEEKASGTKRDGRTELQKVLSVLGEGDALVVTRLDRLGRSLRDLANIAREIEQVAAHLKVLEQNVDTSTAAGRALFRMLAVFAAFETDVRRERQLEGVAMAKRQGVYKGGKARLDRARLGTLARYADHHLCGRFSPTRVANLELIAEIDSQLSAGEQAGGLDKAHHLARAQLLLQELSNRAMLKLTRAISWLSGVIVALTLALVWHDFGRELWSWLLRLLR